MSKKQRRTKRRKRSVVTVDRGAALVDFVQRWVTGQPLPPRGHYGPVDEALVSRLRQRHAQAEEHDMPRTNKPSGQGIQ